MIYLFLADGFETVEALCPLDLLRRAGADVKTVGVTGQAVTSRQGVTVTADVGIDEISVSDAPEMLILPGGIPGADNLDASDKVSEMILDGARRGAFLAAICAAPLILGELGLLDGKEAVCYPGFEKHLKGAKISTEKVAVDGRYITGKGMGVALEFGLALVEALVSEEKADELYAAFQAG